jgi:hypothetical protein
MDVPRSNLTPVRSEGGMQARSLDRITNLHGRERQRPFSACLSKRRRFTPKSGAKAQKMGRKEYGTTRRKKAS